MLYLWTTLALLMPGLVEGEPVPGICELMSGGRVLKLPDPFMEAKRIARDGEFCRAMSRYMTEARRLSDEATRLFLDEQSTDSGAARKFIDQRIANGKGPVNVVGDSFTLSPTVLAFGAHLACLAGDSEAASVMLALGNRDFPGEILDADKALFLLAMGRIEEAKAMIVEEPQNLSQKVVKAVYQCRTQDFSNGADALAAASSEVPSHRVKSALTDLVEPCSQGLLVPEAGP